MDAPRTSTRQRKVQDYSALAKGLESAKKATKQKSCIPVPLKKRSSALDSTEKATKQKSHIPVRKLEKKQTSSASATLTSSVASTSRVPLMGATPTLTQDTNENSPDVDPLSVSTSSASVASTGRVPVQSARPTTSTTTSVNSVDLIQEAAAMANVSSSKYIKGAITN